MNTLWPSGYDRRVHAQLDSTMLEAVRAAPELAGPTWILAHEQAAARGRRGRAWVNPAGNFAATLVMRPSGGPASAALRSFVMSLALYDAFVTCTGRPTGLSLKWPNDVLLNGGKVAGILLESVQVSGVMHLAIGVGVNLRHAPQPEAVEARAVTPVSLLSETGADVTPPEFLDALAAAFAKHEAQFAQFGFAPIRAAWLERAARLGEVIVARTAQSETTGTFADIDLDGQLVLETAKGRVTIPAADVYF
ncbi:biotin--[acetyl-CoA-carboxylase] ligase [Roseobacteraceae bacterium S113]